MSADLCIHVFEGVTEGDLADFFSNTLGSKYFAPRAIGYDHNIFDKMLDTPHVSVGEVSWLKAALTGDGDTYVPDPVGKVNKIIGEDLPTLDEALEQRLLEAMGAPNKTDYDTAPPEKIVAFLRKHRGKRLFTVSW